MKINNFKLRVKINSQENLEKRIMTLQELQQEILHLKMRDRKSFRWL